MQWLACLQWAPVAPIELWGPVRGWNVSVSLHPCCSSGYSVHRSHWHRRMAASCPERRPRGLAGPSAACRSQFTPTSLWRTHGEDAASAWAIKTHAAHIVLSQHLAFIWWEDERVCSSETFSVPALLKSLALRRIWLSHWPSSCSVILVVYFL